MVDKCRCNKRRADAGRVSLLAFGISPRNSQVRNVDDSRKLANLIEKPFNVVVRADNFHVPRPLRINLMIDDRAHVVSNRPQCRRGDSRLNRSQNLVSLFFERQNGFQNFQLLGKFHRLRLEFLEYKFLGSTAGNLYLKILNLALLRSNLFLHRHQELIPDQGQQAAADTRNDEDLVVPLHFREAFCLESHQLPPLVAASSAAGAGAFEGGANSHLNEKVKFPAESVAWASSGFRK